MMLRGDARKRIHGDHQAHHDPTICALFDAARDQGRIEGWQARGRALEAEAREAERRAGDVYQ